VFWEWPVFQAVREWLAFQALKRRLTEANREDALSASRRRKKQRKQKKPKPISLKADLKDYSSYFFIGEKKKTLKGQFDIKGSYSGASMPIMA
jgi:hypothetical protein